MAIYRLLERSAFDSDHMSVAVSAYEHTCRELHLTESRYSAANELVALKVIEIIHSGERDPKRIVERVIAEFRRTNE